jgi:4-amino-4-deoxy-L-arabinose transferase-like glycosyltransferase
MTPLRGLAAGVARRLAATEDRPAVRVALTDRWIVAFSLLGLLLRSWYGLRHQVPSHAGDQGDYVAIGRDFLGWWQSERAFRTPGYPGFMAASFGLGLGENGVRLVQGGILTGGCYLSAVLAARLGGRAAGRAGAAIGALYPPLLTLPSLLLSDALATALVAAAVFVMCEGWSRRERRGWLVSASALGALGTLVRPNVGGLLLVLAAAALLQRAPLRERATTLLAILLPVVLLFGPWVARNYAQLGEPGPLGTNRIPFILGVHLPIDKTTGRYGAHLRDLHYQSGGGPPGVETEAQVEHVDPWHELGQNLTKRPLDQVEASAFWERELWLFPFDDRLTFGGPPLLPFPLLFLAHLALLMLGAVGLWLMRGSAVGRLTMGTVLALSVPFLVMLSSPRLATPAIGLLLAPAGVALATFARRAALALEARAPRVSDRPPPTFTS